MTDLFDLSAQYLEESRLIERDVTQFVNEKIRPRLMHDFEQAHFEAPLVGELGKLGVFGVTLAPELGGSGASYQCYGVICQALERADSAWRSLVSVQNSLCLYPIVTFGSPAQQAAWVDKLIQGQAIGCFGLTEPDSGSDPASMRTTAVPADGGWLLNGSKTWITNAPIADVAVVWAKTPSGIRGFLVETTREGFTTQTIHHKASLRASPTGELIFQNCWLPEDSYLPKTETGLVAALACLSQARFGVAWGAIGAAKDCFERTLDYVKTRQQFGKPLAATQLIQRDCVQMHTEITKADMVNLQLAALKDANRANFEMVSFAKRNACRQALKIARMCRNCLGGNGISLEYDVIRHMNNLESVFTYEGTDTIHTLILGKYLTGLSAF